MADQLLAHVGVQSFARRLEVNAVPPLALLHPGARGLVAIIERVGDPPNLDQGAVHVAGYRDVNPAVVGISREMSSGARAVAWQEVFEFPA